ncbi:MAG: 2-dehydropantoate 2-reductase [Lachnospiraceae bacterium]|nr:2-dehydropantoate 2-reductase [Lachnospiraceae bacterium]
MDIYVDFDDCLCETAKAFSTLVYDMFQIDVPYEDMYYFNLQKSFQLDDEQYTQLLEKGHEPDVLLSYEETPGASDVINEWVRKGHQVSIITGRPFNSFEPSRLWLDKHGFGGIKLYCLDKYGREQRMQYSDFSLKLEDYLQMKFDYAIEDSPSAFRFFDHLPDLNVLVFDRPWNRAAELPGANFRRCIDWEEISKIVQ